MRIMSLDQNRLRLRFIVLIGIGAALVGLPLSVSANNSAQPAAQTPPELGSCNVFPADNAWNTDISNYPLDPNSANYINTIGASVHLHPDFGSDPTYGIPYIVVPGTQPLVPINFTESPDESDPGPYPFPSNAPV